MPDTGYTFAMIRGVPVVATPAEIDLTSTGQLDAVLREAAGGGCPAVVVDMTGTRFCDSAGLHSVLRVHKWLLAEGRQLRLVVAPDSPVSRVASLTGIDTVIACFASLQEALAPPPGGATTEYGLSRPGNGQVPEATGT